MIKRDYYLQKLINSRMNGFPKVITGIRRCGKSYLIKTIYKNYLKNELGVEDSSILVLELDDDRNILYRYPIALGQYVRDYCKDKNECYVFIDEIQLVTKIINPAFTNGKIVVAKDSDNNVISFVDVVLGLAREENIDLYVTGSNSKMLSSDIVTEFRDKATNIHIRPLSFEEYYNYKQGPKSDALYEYLQYGGMPLAVLKNVDERREYLKGLFRLTYFKDILEHNKLTKSDALDALCAIISEGTGDLFNAEKIASTYKSKTKEKIDDQTVSKYINYFVDAFIISEAKRYDVKGRNEIGALRKYYFVDNGLRNAWINFAFDDEGKMLETLIYNELLYNEFTVNVGTFEKIEKDKNGKSVRKNYEIDFMAEKGLRKYYIQVCSDISNIETKEREIRPFIKLNDQIQRIIVINKPIEETKDDNGFTVIGATDFLLRFIK